MDWAFSIGIGVVALAWGFPKLANWLSQWWWTHGRCAICGKKLEGINPVNCKRCGAKWEVYGRMELRPEDKRSSSGGAWDRGPLPHDFSEFLVTTFLYRYAVKVAATEAIAFSVMADTTGSFLLHALLHIRPGETDKRGYRRAREAFERIVQPCIKERKPGCIEVEDQQRMYCLVLPFLEAEQVQLVFALIVIADDQSHAESKLHSLY